MKTSCDLVCNPEPVGGTIAKPAFAQEGDARWDPRELVLEKEPTSILGIAQIVELILKDRDGLDRLAQATPQKVDLASRLLAISLISFALYGLGMSCQWPSPRIARGVCERFAAGKRDEFIERT